MRGWRIWNGAPKHRGRNIDMRRTPGRSNLLRRLEQLESRWTDGSRLVPHSPEWLEFWLKQFHLYTTGQPYVTFTIEAMRAIMQALPEDDDAADNECKVVARLTESPQAAVKS